MKIKSIKAKCSHTDTDIIDMFIMCYPLEGYRLFPLRTIRYFRNLMPDFSTNEIEIFLIYAVSANFKFQA